MHENPILSGRFNLKAVFGAILTVSVGLGLLRVHASLAILFFGLASVLLVQYFVGRASWEGVFWAMMLLVILGCIVVLLANGLSEL